MCKDIDLDYMGYDTSKPMSYVEQLPHRSTPDATANSIIDNVIFQLKRYLTSPWTCCGDSLYKYFTHIHTRNIFLHLISEDEKIEYSSDVCAILHEFAGQCNRYDETFINATKIDQSQLASHRFTEYFSDYFNKDSFINDTNNHLRLLHIKGLRSWPERTRNTMDVLICVIQFTFTENDLSGIERIDIYVNKANYLNCLQDDTRTADAQYFVHLASTNHGDITETMAMCSRDCKVVKYDSINTPRDSNLKPSVSMPMSRWLEYMRICKSTHEHSYEDATYETVLRTDELTRIKGVLRYRYLGRWPNNMDAIIESEPSFAELPNDGLERMITYPFEYDIHYDLSGLINRFEIHRNLNDVSACYQTDEDIVSKTINEAAANVIEQNRVDLAEDIFCALEHLLEKERTDNTIKRVSDRLQDCTSMNREEAAKVLGSYLAQTIK
jgi:hypothetical protein